MRVLIGTKEQRVEPVLEIEIGKLLAGVVADNEARGLFFDGPRRREAALRRMRGV
jgi:hypothetical protein